MSKLEKAEKEKFANRPLEILDGMLKEEVQYKGYDYFDDIYLIQNSVPTIAFDKIDLSTDFLGKKLQYPIMFSALTGGHDELVNINTRLGEFANAYHIGMIIGDQIYGLKKPKTAGSYTVARKSHPNGLLIGNINGSDLLSPTFTLESFRTCIDMIGADAIEIYLNPLQQLMRHETPAGYQGIYEKLQTFMEESSIPILIKSFGTGFAHEDIRKFWDLGIMGFDIQGVGGSSFARLETVRNLTLMEKQGGLETLQPFDFWGIPTVWSLLDISLRPENADVPLIVGGGIRNGIQAVKALAMGADLISLGYPVLIQLIEDFGHPEESNLKDWMDNFIREMKMTMFLLGASNLDELREIARTKVGIFGKSKEWLEERGINFPVGKVK